MFGGGCPSFSVPYIHRAPPSGGALLVSFCYPLALGFLGLSLLARALGAFRPCFGAPARGIRRFLRFLEVFWRFFSTHKTHWLGCLMFVRVFETLSRPCLCPTSPIFGLQGRLGICIVVWVAAARRKKRRTSSVFLLVRSGLTGFQLYSVLVSCLEDSQVIWMVMLEEFRKETLWCESRKTDLHGKRNAGIVDWVAAGTR